MIEDLIRIEHKLDLIIRALQTSGLMVTDLPNLNGIEKDTCALCNKPINILIDASKGELQRKCSCVLPKKAYKLEVTTQTIKKEADDANYRTVDI